MKKFLASMLLLLIGGALLSGCTGSVSPTPGEQPSPGGLAEDGRLQVVATNTIVADVVRQVGGTFIDLHTLLPVGADPHSYQPTPQDLRLLTDADLIFINGFGLEEALSGTLDDFAKKSVAVSDGVEPLTLDQEHEDEHAEEHGEEEHEDEHADHHGGVDPHTWLSVPSVEIWASNVATALSQADPDHADAYQSAAATYVETLQSLHAELLAAVETLPAGRRQLVTDHNEFGYFAHTYGFEIVGAVIPGFSTLTEPSAQQVAALQDQIRAQGIKSIFVGGNVSPGLTQQLAQDLGVTLVPLYTASLSAADGPASSYVEMMRYNVDAIVRALGQ